MPIANSNIARIALLLGDIIKNFSIKKILLFKAKTAAIELVNESPHNNKLGCFQIRRCLTIAANATLALAISSSVKVN